MADWKRKAMNDWIATGVPVILDVSNGYDGRKFFGDATWHWSDTAVSRPHVDPIESSGAPTRRGPSLIPRAYPLWRMPGSFGSRPSAPNSHYAASSASASGCPGEGRHISGTGQGERLRHGQESA